MELTTGTKSREKPQCDSPKLKYSLPEHTKQYFKQRKICQQCLF